MNIVRTVYRAALLLKIFFAKIVADNYVRFDKKACQK